MACRLRCRTKPGSPPSGHRPAPAGCLSSTAPDGRSTRPRRVPPLARAQASRCPTSGPPCPPGTARHRACRIATGAPANTGPAPCARPRSLSCPRCRCGRSARRSSSDCRCARPRRAACRSIRDRPAHRFFRRSRSCASPAPRMHSTRHRARRTTPSVPACRAYAATPVHRKGRARQRCTRYRRWGSPQR